jgi:hypothetical protein
VSVPQISLDPAGLNPVEEKLRGPLEDQLTSALQAATDKITSAYAGENADQVTAMLLAETKAGLHPDIAHDHREWSANAVVEAEWRLSRTSGALQWYRYAAVLRALQRV